MRREDDKRVAEIMGWEVVNISGVFCYVQYIDGNTTNYIGVPRFTSDPAADYTVLEWVRGRHSSETMLFRDEVAKIFEKRAQAISLPLSQVIQYKPGDYSRALLELDKKGVLK